MLIDDQKPMTALFRNMAASVDEQALPESYQVRGLWHNLAFKVDGDVLSVAVAIPNGRHGPPPTIKIQLCPKKILHWRIANGHVLVPADAWLPLMTTKEIANV